MARNRKGALKSLLLGILTAALITIAAMLLTSVALVYLRFSDRLLTLINQLVKLASIVLGVCVALPRGGERGLANGVAIALFYMASGYALYVLLGGGRFSASGMLGEMMLGAAAGAVTGAIRANMAPARRNRGAARA